MGALRAAAFSLLAPDSVIAFYHKQNGFHCGQYQWRLLRLPNVQGGAQRRS